MIPEHDTDAGREPCGACGLLGYDVFDIGLDASPVHQVQRCNRCARMTDDQAVAAFRTGGFICDDHGNVTGPEVERWERATGRTGERPRA